METERHSRVTLLSEALEPAPGLRSAEVDKQLVTFWISHELLIPASKAPPSEAWFKRAEGTGLEPATGFPAPHFQCGR